MLERGIEDAKWFLEIQRRISSHFYDGADNFSIDGDNICFSAYEYDRWKDQIRTDWSIPYYILFGDENILQLFVEKTNDDRKAADLRKEALEKKKKEEKKLKEAEIKLSAEFKEYEQLRKKFGNIY